MEVPNLSGDYVIASILKQETKIVIKSLGSHIFPTGLYCYCGSARGPGGLKARIDRHLRPDTKRFWHYDYLKDSVEVHQVWWQVDRRRVECEIAQFLAMMNDADTPIKGFGASDCKSGCNSHLIHFKNSAVKDELFRELKKAALISERKETIP